MNVEETMISAYAGIDDKAVTRKCSVSANAYGGVGKCHNTSRLYLNVCLHILAMCAQLSDFSLHAKANTLVSKRDCNLNLTFFAFILCKFRYLCLLSDDSSPLVWLNRIILSYGE